METSHLIILAVLTLGIIVREVLGTLIFLRDPRVRRLALQGLARLRRRGAWFLASLGVLLALSAGAPVQAQEPPKPAPVTFLVPPAEVLECEPGWRTVKVPGAPEGVVTCDRWETRVTIEPGTVELY